MNSKHIKKDLQKIKNEKSSMRQEIVKKKISLHDINQKMQSDQ